MILTHAETVNDGFDGFVRVWEVGMVISTLQNTLNTIFFYKLYLQ